MKTFVRLLAENEECGVATSPIHCNERPPCLRESWFNQSDDDISTLDRDLKRHSNVTDNDHIREIKKYSGGSFDLNQKLISARLNNKTLGRHIEGTNHDWFGSKGADVPPNYDGYRPFSVTHDTKHLDDLTERPIGRHMSVYAGIRYAPEELAKNNRLLVPSYLSTTIHRPVTQEFANGRDGTKRVIHVHVTPENRGRYINEHHTFQSGEYKEMLFPRNSTLRFHSIEDGGNGYRVYHASIHN